MARSCEQLDYGFEATHAREYSVVSTSIDPIGLSVLTLYEEYFGDRSRAEKLNEMITIPIKQEGLSFKLETAKPVEVLKDTIYCETLPFSSMLCQFIDFVPNSDISVDIVEDLCDLAVESNKRGDMVTLQFTTKEHNGETRLTGFVLNYTDNEGASHEIPW